MRRDVISSGLLSSGQTTTWRRRYVSNSTLLSRIQVNPTPYGCAVTPDGRTCYVTSDAYATVTPIDVETGAVGSTTPTGGGPYNIAFTPDGAKGYVANSAGGSVTVFQVSDGSVLQTITAGGEMLGVAVTPDGAYCLAVSWTDGTIYKIDTSTDAIVGSPLALGGTPNGGMAISPDGSTCWVVLAAPDTLVSVDVATMSLTGSPISVGVAPVGFALSLDGSTGYVVSTGDNTVVPVTLSTRTVGSAISVGREPIGVVLSPDGAMAYVTNARDGTVSPIDLALGLAGEPLEVGANPQFPAITPDGSMVFVPNKATRADPYGSVSRIVSVPWFPLSLARSVPAAPTAGSYNFFGYETITGNWDAIPSGYAQVSPFTLSEDGEAIRARIYLDGNGGSAGSQIIRAIVFADAGSTPGTRAMVSSQATISAGQAAGWVYFDFHGEQLPSGLYWVGFMAGDTNTVARFNYTSIGNSRMYRSWTYASGAPSPFGTPDATDDHQIACAIDYISRA